MLVARIVFNLYKIFIKLLVYQYNLLKFIRKQSWNECKVLLLGEHRSVMVVVNHASGIGFISAEQLAERFNVSIDRVLFFLEDPLSGAVSSYEILPVRSK